MDQLVEKKYNRLLDYISSFEKVGVACSGGVDSTLLAHAAIQALGPQSVLILFAESCLLAEATTHRIDNLFLREFSQPVQFNKITVDVLADSELTRNDQTRCYTCKKKIYTELLKQLRRNKITTLFDGTNCDDLNEDRPGLKAIKELGVITPLVETGFYKKDIRVLARALNLSNADLASDSCMATRIETGRKITYSLLQQIEQMEAFMKSLGYLGCRVRPQSERVIIEVLKKDLSRIVAEGERQAIETYFQHNGYPKVLLHLKPRKG